MAGLPRPHFVRPRNDWAFVTPFENVGWVLTQQCHVILSLFAKNLKKIFEGTVTASDSVAVQ